MNISVFTYPQNKAFEGKIDPQLSEKDVIKTILNTEDIGEQKLIVDRSQHFHRIPEDDPVNQYYNGRIGELYRITDGSSVRYRMVVPAFVVAKEKTKKEARVTPEIYASAYENVLTMLRDRGCNDKIVSKYSIPRDRLIDFYKNATFNELTIPVLKSSEPQLIDSRGRAIYVFFLKPEDDMVICRRSAEYKNALVLFMNDVITHHNSVTGENLMSYTVNDLQKENLMRDFSERFEIVIIYNNPQCKSEFNTGITPKFYQTFPAQKMSYVVIHHIDQPEFYLLDGKKDRQEIFNMYAHNGRVLDEGKRLENYGLRDGVRFLLI